MHLFSPGLSSEEIMRACVPDLMASSLNGRSLSPTTGPQVTSSGTLSSEDPTASSPRRVTSSSTTQEVTWMAWVTSLRSGASSALARSRALEAGLSSLPTAVREAARANLLTLVTHWEDELTTWTSDPTTHTVGLFDPSSRSFSPASPLMQLLAAFPHAQRRNQAVASLPHPVASWVLSARRHLSLDTLLAHRSPYPATHDHVLEVALGLWDPTAPAPASSLAKAIQAAELLS